jgi:hypothetical protein
VRFPFRSAAGSPTFTISDHCPNCDFVRLTIVSDDLGGRLVGREYLTSMLAQDVPIDVPFSEVIGSLQPLPEGRYEFHAEGIVGIFAEGDFAVDPKDNSFLYVAGTSLRDEIAFTVPEPPGPLSALAAALVFAWRMRACGRHLRRRGR